MPLYFFCSTASASFGMVVTVHRAHGGLYPHSYRDSTDREAQAEIAQIEIMRQRSADRDSTGREAQADRDRDSTL